MQFSTGLLDWLFGEKITIELPNGQKRVVTKRWWAEMERQGKVKPVVPDSRNSSDGSLADLSPASMFKHAETITTTSLTSLEHSLPAFKRLIARDGLDNWSYCFSIAFAYTVVREQPDTLSDDDFDNFRESVQQFIPQWQPDGVDGFNNLHEFIEMGDDIPYQHSLGMWVLWNLAGNRPTQPDEIQVAVVLGGFIVEHVGEWWGLT